MATAEAVCVCVGVEGSRLQWRDGRDEMGVTRLSIIRSIGDLTQHVFTVSNKCWQ